MLRLLLLTLLGLSMLNARSQTTIYLPFALNQARHQAILSSLDARYQRDLEALKGRDNRKDLSEIFKSRYETIRQAFVDNEALLNDTAQGYLESLLEPIRRQHPDHDWNELRLVFSRSPEMNASSMGEGTLFFNIGLFRRLHNESEAAFVLCHELAHYFLGHGNNEIYRKVDHINSKEFKDKVKQIARQQYGQGQAIRELYTDFVFVNRRHGRQVEEAADSMAFELMRGTPYDLRGVLTGLALLDSSDQEKYKEPLALESRFSFANYPFRKSWLESDELIMTGTTTAKDSALRDSLKTHPDIDKRIARLQERVGKYNTGHNAANPVNAALFTALQLRFDNEIIVYCYERENYTRALYYALLMARSFPNDAWLHTFCGRVLNDFYERQKAHQLGRVAERPNNNKHDDYNKLLVMVDNLRLGEIASIAYYYFEQQSPRFAGYPAFASEQARSKAHFQQ
ncbi:M48 family metalloprotease [Flaviaesturariibacter terrae]